MEMSSLIHGPAALPLGANFRKMSQYHISWKSAQQFSSTYMRTDKEIYMTNCRTRFLQLFAANVTEKVNNLYARFVRVFKQDNWTSNSAPGCPRCDQNASLQGMQSCLEVNDWTNMYEAWNCTVQFMTIFLHRFYADWATGHYVGWRVSFFFFFILCPCKSPSCSFNHHFTFVYTQSSVLAFMGSWRWNNV
jgi:hypothetical protein